MADKWDVFTTWQCVLPPSRPAEWQLEVIRNSIANSDKPKVAVLGATIEFRDLLAECNVSDIYIFENNHHYFKEISRYRKHRNKEVKIWGDWLKTLGQYPQFFDFILSDLTSGNISYDNRELFYSGVSGALKEDGLFIDRILTKPLPFIPIDFLIEKYRKMTITNRSINDFNCEVLFCSSLLENSDYKVDTSQFYDYLLSLNIPIMTDFVKSCYLITPRDCVWWYSKDWDEEKTLYTKKFSIISEVPEPDHSAYAERAKLLLSKRRD